MSLRTPDFESGAYTNFATPAMVGEDNKSSYYGIANAEVWSAAAALECGGLTPPWSAAA
jgi:hypothetical protein